MRLMILLLQYQYPITRCSVSVHYFPSAPSEYHPRSVKLTQMLNKETDIESDERNNEDVDHDKQTLYWVDAIDEYFDRPKHKLLENQTISKITQSDPKSKLFDTKDKKGRVIVRRMS